MSKKEKIEDKIKDLNATRAMFHRDFERFEKQYKDKDISKEEFKKHKINYEKKREKIRIKIHALEGKLEQLRKNSQMIK
jgi:predicted DNA binding CopG/RHH family protein